MTKAGAKGGDGDKLQQKSPAEFFAENKNIAGFDNVGLPVFQQMPSRSLQQAHAFMCCAVCSQASVFTPL